jgi:hypothetical protein
MKETSTYRNVIILGAGFSTCAGLPIQSEFPSLLLSSEFSTELDIAITKTLKIFLKDVFGWSSGSTLPDLEDFFTCIDLAAGSGHHLGIQYRPKALRAIRRMAIYRIFSVLDRRFSYSSDIDSLLCKYWAEPYRRPAFIVLNWDIVLEKHLMRLVPCPIITYCCRSYNWNSVSEADESKSTGDLVPICKMHGSSNWVYCDNCHALFYDLDRKLPLKMQVGLVKADFRLFDERFTNQSFDRELGITPERRKCLHCKNILSSHIATFSYRKSFRTHAYASIWNRAAEILADAHRWIFIGYSLSKADFELKHLLKMAQLRFAHRRKSRRLPEIHVVTKADRPPLSYEGFFGKGSFEFWGDGLAGYVHSGFVNPLSCP